MERREDLSRPRLGWNARAARDGLEHDDAPASDAGSCRGGVTHSGIVTFSDQAISLHKELYDTFRRHGTRGRHEPDGGKPTGAFDAFGEELVALDCRPRAADDRPRHDLEEGLSRLSCVRRRVKKVPLTPASMQSLDRHISHESQEPATWDSC